jgi:hypothetical protein
MERTDAGASDRSGPDAVGVEVEQRHPRRPRVREQLREAGASAGAHACYGEELLLCPLKEGVRFAPIRRSAPSCKAARPRSVDEGWG